MRSRSIVALSGLLSFAAAAPLTKRDVVWVVETEVDVVTVPVITTVWVDATNGPFLPRPTLLYDHQPAYTALAAPSWPTESSSAVPSTSPPEVAPLTQSSTPVDITPSSTLVSVATPAPSFAYAAPVPPAYGTPTTTSQATASSTYAGIPSAAATTFLTGTRYSGDITYYAPGLGSCGVVNTETDSIVALAHVMMDNGANPNNNPTCGKSITISYGGVQRQAKIMDTCMGCDGASIDLTPSLFTAFAELGQGRVHDVDWWFD